MKTKKYRLLNTIILIIVFLFPFFFLNKDQDNNLINLSEKSSISSGIPESEESYLSGTLDLEGKYSPEFPSEINIHIQYLELIGEEALISYNNNEQICILEYEFGHSSTSSNYSKLDCATIYAGGAVFPLDQKAFNGYFSIRDFFNFPFDTIYYYDNSAIITKIIKDGNIIDVLSIKLPNTIIRSYENNWVEKNYIEKDGNIKIVLERPIYLKIIIPILLLFLITIQFIITRIDDVDSLIKIILPLLLGIWGIRRIFIPSDILFPIAFDYIILSLYLSCFINILFCIIKRKNTNK